MNGPGHPTPLLHDYVDGALDAAGAREVETHLQQCPACRDALADLQALLARLEALPREVTPPDDLWAGIEARLAPPAPEAPPQRRAAGDRAPLRLAPRSFRGRAFAAAAGLALVAAVAFLLWQSTSPGWTVAPVAGRPVVGERLLEDAATMRVGDWLETDTGARAQLEVGSIGYVEVGPESRLQLLSAAAEDHRVALARGRIHARIWAPPRLFFVETPSATAIDLGCEYVLEVDSTGGSLLHVLSGYVGMEYGTRESIVPAGWMVATRRGELPGTPYREDAPDVLRDALYRFDFEGGRADALAAVLSAARPADAHTLWSLLTRVPVRDRQGVYDRMAELVAPPPGVTRAGVLGGDEAMQRAWREKLGVDVLSWSNAEKLKKKKRMEAEQARQRAMQNR